jgi:hypothetical protein
VEALKTYKGVVMMQIHIIGLDGDSFPICPICWDASRMNRDGECNECLDDAHALEILAGGK